MKSKKKTTSLEENAVIYRDESDDVWIAHGLHTDQVGTGRRIVDALADLIKAVDQVCALARRDNSIALLREAPAAVKRMFRSAKPLPSEIYEVAHKMARGKWPDYISPDFSPRVDAAPFKAEVSTVFASK